MDYVDLLDGRFCKCWLFHAAPACINCVAWAACASADQFT